MRLFRWLTARYRRWRYPLRLVPPSPVKRGVSETIEARDRLGGGMP